MHLQKEDDMFNCLLFELLLRNKDKTKKLLKEFSFIVDEKGLAPINKGLKIAKHYITKGIKFAFNGVNYHANSHFGIPIDKVNFSGMVGEPMSTAMAIIYASLIGGGTVGLSSMFGGKKDGIPDDYRRMFDLQEGMLERGADWQKFAIPQQKEFFTKLSEWAKSRMGSTELDRDTALAIRDQYEKAGTEQGTYLASRGMMGSGVADRMFQNLEQDKTENVLNTLWSQQREGRTMAGSLLNQGYPYANTMQFPSMPYASTPTGGGGMQGMDWGALGDMFSRSFNKPGAQTAQPYGDPIGGGYPGGYSSMGF